MAKKNGNHARIPPLSKNWLAGVSVFKNVTWDQPRFEFLILNFEKSSQTFFLIMWLPWLIGSSINEVHSNLIV